MQADFDEINVVLAELVGDVQDRLASVSQWMGILDWVGGRTDEAIVNFSLRHARDAAWDVAERFVHLEGDARTGAESGLDTGVTRLAERVAHPGIPLSIALTPVRLRERAPVSEMIAALMRPQVAA